MFILQSESFAIGGGLTISPNHTFAKQKIKILFTEREFSHITTPGKKNKTVNWIISNEVKGFV